ncbi:UDP-glucose 4-epimerase GalE [bacterium]|nr:UDP-glucose 4-epimerase GalE [bacterium]
MKVLVVGGAGYIGSHTVRLLQKEGHQPIILDNLCAGHEEAARRLKVPFEKGDLGDIPRVKGVLADHRPEVVMHFAAFALVGESVTQPKKYYHNNVVSTLNLLDAMNDAGIKKFIFSSTCATYGNPQRPALDETHPQKPINPYGWSKWMVEQILRDYDRAYEMKHVALRYFNAAGGSPDGLIGEDHDPETHLIPVALQAVIGKRPGVTVFGTDYDTPDGTCVRDYIHVDDLAKAHILAIEHLNGGGESKMLNCGTGKGHSVKEVLDTVERVTGRKLNVTYGPRREGDPPVLVAVADQIRTLFGWKPQYTELEPIVRTAWTWFEKGGTYRPS